MATGPLGNRSDLSALYVTNLVAEGKQRQALTYLHSLHKANLALWIETKKQLYVMAQNNKLLSIYSSIIEASACVNISERSHLIAGWDDSVEL